MTNTMPVPACDLERTLFLTAASHGARYLASVRDRRVAPSAADIQALEALGGPLPDNGSDPAAVLDLLDRIGSPATVANAGGRYFGFVNGGAVPAARAAMVLATAWDQNAGF
jgi:hypothetical protein